MVMNLSELHERIARWENLHTEFKEWPVHPDDLAASFVAFANTDGVVYPRIVSTDLGGLFCKIGIVAGVRPEPSATDLRETKEIFPMAQPDALDVALKQLAQSFADLGLVVNVMRQLKHNAAQLGPTALNMRSHAISAIPLGKGFTGFVGPPDNFRYFLEPVLSHQSGR
jgi:hypothetical protein